MREYIKAILPICATLALCWSAQADLKNGLRAHYKLDGNAIDETGNYHGSAHGATATTDRFGNANSAYQFDGNNDYIRIGSEPNFPCWENYTVSVWFLNNGAGDNTGYGQKLIDKTAWLHDWYCSINTAGALRLHLYENNKTAGLPHSTTNYLDSQWHHLTVSKSGNLASMWVDGNYTGSISNALQVYSPSDLLIGTSSSRDNLQRRYWSGKIDDVYIYDRALTPTEIKELAETEISPFALTQGTYLFDVKVDTRLLLEEKDGVTISKDKFRGILIYDADTGTSRFVYKENQELVSFDATFSYTLHSNSENESKNAITARGTVSAVLNIDSLLNSVILGVFRYKETDKSSDMAIALSGTGINTDDGIYGALQLRYNQKSSTIANSQKNGLYTVIAKTLDLRVKVVKKALSKR